MPTVDHKDQPSLADAVKAAAPAPTVAPVAAQSIPKQPTAEESAKIVAEALANGGASNIDLEKLVESILLKKKVERQAATAPKEPDWKNLTEAQAYSKDVYIPVIEHDIPDYMNIELKDTEYEAVWASRDQRRLGQLYAEGYEPIKAEHMRTGFHLPLKFDSEGLYVYQDVIAMRVHKRILYGKRRKALEISMGQLRRRGADAKIKQKLSAMIAEDPFFEHLMGSQKMGFYDTDAV
jgi:hypothetical protein